MRITHVDYDFGPAARNRIDHAADPGPDGAVAALETTRRPAAPPRPASGERDADRGWPGCHRLAQRRGGRARRDVAMAWLIIATSEVDQPPPLRPGISLIRAVLLRRFRALVHDDPGPEMARVARARRADRNVRPGRSASFSVLIPGGRHAA